jgi:hypothetical protein
MLTLPCFTTNCALLVLACEPGGQFIPPLSAEYQGSDMVYISAYMLSAEKLLV